MKTVRGIKRAAGVEVKVKCEKNKVALAYREAQFNIQFAYGIDDVESCLDFLADADGLSDLGIAKSSIGKHVTAMKKMDTKTYWAEVDKIYKLTETYWYEVEKGFLPVRKKYND